MIGPSELCRIATTLGGLPISGCLRGSPADRAGLRYGDIVMSINDMPTASWAEFFQAHRRCSGRMRVRVFRRGVELEVALDLPAHSRTPREVLEDASRRAIVTASAAS